MVPNLTLPSLFRYDNQPNEFVILHSSVISLSDGTDTETSVLMSVPLPEMHKLFHVNDKQL